MIQVNPLSIHFAIFITINETQNSIEFSFEVTVIILVPKYRNKAKRSWESAFGFCTNQAMAVGCRDIRIANKKSACACYCWVALANARRYWKWSRFNSNQTWIFRKSAYQLNGNENAINLVPNDSPISWLAHLCVLCRWVVSMVVAAVFTCMAAGDMRIFVSQWVPTHFYHRII